MVLAKMRHEVRQRSAQFAISARKYADAAARFGQWSDDPVKLIDEIESARRHAEADFAALKTCIASNGLIPL